MKFKSLLTLSLATACSALPMIAAETIAVNGAPVTLDYDKCDTSGDFFSAEGKNPGSNITYQLNVGQPGDYLLYVSTGNKLNGGQIHKYDVEVNGELAATYEIDHMIGGNWNNFVMLPEVVTLPAGDVSLKIIQNGERQYFDMDTAPYLIPVGKSYDLGTEEVDLDLLHSDPTSNMVFTRFAAFGVDNSGFGDANSVLVTSQDFSGNNGTKMQACYPKTKLRFLVNVDREGNYPVTLGGYFVVAPDGSKELIPDFPVTINATWDGVSYLSEGVVTNFEGSNTDATATGTVLLKKGTYYLEVSSNYAFEDALCLSSLSIGVPEDGDTEAAPVGKYIPVIAFDTPVNAFLGHEFTLSGVIALDQPDDEIKSAKLYLGDEELGDLTIGEGNTFTYDVKDLSKLNEVGDYTFAATVATKRDYSATSEVTVNIKKQTFTISAFAGNGGVISFADDNNVVEEGDNITCTITPNEGYEIESIKVNDAEIEFTAGADGSATYTFENVTANQMIEANFSLKSFTVTVTQAENGKVTTSAADGIVEYGSSLVVTATPDQGYVVSSVSVDGVEVDYKLDGNVATYTVENVKGDISVTASFTEYNSVDGILNGSYGVVKADGGLYVTVDEPASVILMDVTGKVLYNDVVSASAYIATDAKGVVIVRIANKNSVKDLKVIL